MKLELTIENTEGLHASLASKIVQLSGKYKTELRIEYVDKVVDAKSILGLMSLAVPKGDNVTVVAEGEDAEKALEEIKKILG